MDGEIRAIREQYLGKGYAAPISLLSATELARYQKEFQTLEAAAHGTPERYLNPQLYFGWVREFASHPRLLDIARSILGPNLFVMGCMFLCKRPATSSHFPWHQDGYFFSEHMKAPYLTAWIALTDSNRENGCMEVIPGSHLQGIVPHQDLADPSNMIRQKKGVPKVDEDRGMDIVLRPGEMSLHHGAILHRSYPNTSTGTRVGFILRISTEELEKAPYPLVRLSGEQSPAQLPVFEEPAPESPELELSNFLASL